MTAPPQPLAPEAPEPPADSPQPRLQATRKLRQAGILAVAALGYEAVSHGPLAILQLPEVLWYVGATALPPGLIGATLAAILAKVLRFDQAWHPRVVHAALRAGWAHFALFVGAAVVRTDPTDATTWLVMAVAAVGPELVRLLWADAEKFDLARYRKLKRQGKKWPG